MIDVMYIMTCLQKADVSFIFVNMRPQLNDVLYDHEGESDAILQAGY